MPCGERAVDDDFDGFIRRGGLAGSYDYDDISESYGYICDVYKTILTRDLVQKFSLTDSTVLERLAEYMMDNSGNLNSPNNIANVLDANRVPTNRVNVGRYISYLRDAFVFYEAKRYDIKGKKCLSTQAKHYVCDSGMHYAVLGTRDMDWGRMYENAAILELMRRGYETYVGKLYQKEVDFVAKRGPELVYIQVGDDISSDSTLERELAPAWEAPLSYRRPKARINLLLNKLNQLQVFNGVVEAAERMVVKGGSWVHRPGPSLFSICDAAIAREGGSC